MKRTATALLVTALAVPAALLAASSSASAGPIPCVGVHVNGDSVAVTGFNHSEVVQKDVPVTSPRDVSQAVCYAG